MNKNSRKRSEIKMYAVESRSSFEISSKDVERFKQQSLLRDKKLKALSLSDIDFDKVIVSSENKMTKDNRQD